MCAERAMKVGLDPIGNATLMTLPGGGCQGAAAVVRLIVSRRSGAVTSQSALCLSVVRVPSRGFVANCVLAGVFWNKWAPSLPLF